MTVKGVNGGAVSAMILAVCMMACAAVADDLPVSLLGQSYLQRVSSVELRGDTMVLH